MRYRGAKMRALLILVVLPFTLAQINFSAHLSRVNQLRAQNGVGPLQIDSRLNSCAQAHAQDMSAIVGLSHTGSDGSTPGERIRNCVNQNDIFAAENAGAGFSNDLSAIESWNTSPGHRANMLNGDYNFIGVGRVGSYWVQNFAGGLNGGGQQPAPQPRPQPQPQPQPQPRPQSSPQPRPQQPSPQPNQQQTTRPPQITTALRTTRRTTTTRIRITRSNSPIPVPSFNPDQPIEQGILVENIPGIDSIVPSDFDNSIGDYSGADQDDIDDRLYAGSEEERKKQLAEVAMDELSPEDKEAFLKAKEIYGDEFNPFMLLSTSGSTRRWSINKGGVAMGVVLCIVGVFMV